jgi:uncharacterized cupin superfamily protein
MIFQHTLWPHAGLDRGYAAAALSVTLSAILNRHPTPMSSEPIYCEHKPSPAKLDVLGAYDWPIWKKEVSTFPWTYAEQETCYILKGRFIVTPDGGEPQEFKRGDLITFPKGMSCTWEILEDVEKHYTLG